MGERTPSAPRWRQLYAAVDGAVTPRAEAFVRTSTFAEGAALVQRAQKLARDNGMLTDRLQIGGDPVHLRDITAPFLTVRANRDHIAPPDASAPLIDLVGSQDKHELRLDAGHMGLVVGRTAACTTVPTILDFLHRRCEAAA